MTTKDAIIAKLNEKVGDLEVEIVSPHFYSGTIVCSDGFMSFISAKSTKLQH